MRQFPSKLSASLDKVNSYNGLYFIFEYFLKLATHVGHEENYLLLKFGS